MDGGIEMTGLVKSYGDRRVLDGLDLQRRAGHPGPAGPQRRR